MIDIRKSINDIKTSLINSKRYNEFEASQIAPQAKFGYSNFNRFESARRQLADRQIALAARSLNLV